MKKNLMEQKINRSLTLRAQEPLWDRDWCSLGTKASYWSGSPWRAFSVASHRNATV